MDKLCYWGTKGTVAHKSQCLTTCHHPMVRAIVTDEFCSNCPYKENMTRPQGEWIPNYTSQFRNPGRHCSLCGKVVEFSENFCPNCGAYMRGNDNG